MLKKTVTYTDFNGIDRTEDFYFNLTKAELAEMELSVEGGYAEYVRKIANANDTPTLATIFKELVMKAYGERSADGRSFMKMDEEGRPLHRKFVQTAAYSEIYMDLATNTEHAVEFMNGVIPKALADEVKKHPELTRI